MTVIDFDNKTSCSWVSDSSHPPHSDDCSPAKTKQPHQGLFGVMTLHQSGRLVMTVGASVGLNILYIHYVLAESPGAV